MNQIQIRKYVGYIIIFNALLLSFGALLQYFAAKQVVIIGDFLYLFAYILLPFTITSIVYNKWQKLGWGGIASYILLLIGSSLVAIYQFLQTTYDTGTAESMKLLRMTVLGVSFSWLGMIIIVFGILSIALTMLYGKVYNEMAPRLMLLGIVLVIISELSKDLGLLWPIGVTVISIGVALTSLDFLSITTAAKKPKKK